MNTVVCSYKKYVRGTIYVRYCFTGVKNLKFCIEQKGCIVILVHAMKLLSDDEVICRLKSRGL